MRANELAAPLLEEVDAELAQVWRFILEREVEAPERFQVGSSSLNPKVLTLKQLLSSVNCP